MPNRSSESWEYLNLPANPCDRSAMVERLRRNPQVELDPFVANGSLLYTSAGRQALSDLWREYIEIAQKHDMDILLYIPTWRVNVERLTLAGLPGINQVAMDAFALLDGLRSEYGEFGRKIFIGGLVGCKGDAYAPQEALGIEDARVLSSLTSCRCLRKIRHRFFARNYDPFSEAKPQA